MMETMNWSATTEDVETIRLIAQRFLNISRENLGYTQIDLFVTTCMDITACHLNGCPLKLKDLLEADEFNFTHDVVEINRNIDRNTGELLNGFLPRYSVSGAEPDPNQTSFFQES